MVNKVISITAFAFGRRAKYSLKAQISPPFLVWWIFVQIHFLLNVPGSQKFQQHSHDLFSIVGRYVEISGQLFSVFLSYRIGCKESDT